MQLTQDKNKNIEMIKEASKLSFPDNQILADLTAAQAILESGILRGSGPSELAVRYCNLFGIKGEGTNGSISLPTHEYENGKMITVNQPFAWNKTIVDSFSQHARLFDLDRYANLWDATSFEEAANEIREDGYATDPSYSQSLIEIYNNYLS